MAVALQTLLVYRGERVSVTFTMTPAESIAGWTLVFTVAAAFDQAPPKLLTVTPTIVDGPNGVLRVDLTAAQTAGLAVGHYAFDLWRTNPGSEEVLALGAFLVEPNVRVPVV